MDIEERRIGEEIVNSHQVVISGAGDSKAPRRLVMTLPYQPSDADLDLLILRTVLKGLGVVRIAWEVEGALEVVYYETLDDQRAASGEAEGGWLKMHRLIKEAIEKAEYGFCEECGRPTSAAVQDVEEIPEHKRVEWRSYRNHGAKRWLCGKHTRKHRVFSVTGEVLPDA